MSDIDNPQKPANVKPREFFIDSECRWACETHATEFPGPTEIHVIEKSYADQLERELEELKSKPMAVLLDGPTEIVLRESAAIKGYQQAIKDNMILRHQMHERERELTARADQLERERDHWKWEYENLCKFANDYEARAEKAEADLAVTLKRYQQKERANKERARRLLID